MSLRTLLKLTKISVILSVLLMLVTYGGMSSGFSPCYNDGVKTASFLVAVDNPSPSQEPGTDVNSPSPGDTPIDGAKPSPQQAASPSTSPEQSGTPAAKPSAAPSPVPSFIEPSPQTTPNPIVAPSPLPDKKKQVPPPDAQLREENRRLLKNRIANYVEAAGTWQKPTVGICVETLETGDVIYGKNDNRPLIPASNLKVVTTAVALALLGPNFQFETSIWGNTADSNGVMKGNLYLRGTGDPTFMEPFTNDPTEVLDKMAQVLKKRGVKVIEGDLVGDDSAFDREFLGRGWKPRYLLYDYAAPAGALSINANTVRLIIKNGSTRMVPDNNYMKIVYKKTGQSNVYVDRKLGTDTITISGSSPGTIYRNLTINNPSKLTTYAFASILKSKGIRIAGKVRLINHDDSEYMKNTHKVCFHLSIPLKKIVRQINKESDNVCAQHVFKAISYYIKGKGSCDNSNETIREFMKKAGIDASGFRMADGSGLSEYNRISPHQMCQVLRYMYNHPNGKVFFSSLPVAGKDGTLSYRMAGISVNAKTGSLNGQIALSGYVKTASGQTLVFSVMTNYHPYSNGAIRGNEDQLLRVIASFGGKL